MKLKVFALAMLVSVTMFANNPIKVQVVDDNNEPLTGVKLSIEDAESAKFTDFDGVGEIEVNETEQLLKVEFAGFETSYIKIVPGTSISDIEVTLLKK